MATEFGLRFVGDVDPRLRQEAIAFARWVREWYTFTNRLELRLVHKRMIIDRDGEDCALRWWWSSRGGEPFFAEIAVGDFAETFDSHGYGVAYATVIEAIGRVLKYYYQATRDSPIREDYAVAFGTRLFDAYASGETPPRPWRGATLRVQRGL